MKINEKVFYSDFCSETEKNSVIALLEDLDQKAINAETRRIRFLNEFANEEHEGEAITIKTSDGTYLYIEDTYLDMPYSIERIS